MIQQRLLQACSLHSYAFFNISNLFSSYKIEVGKMQFRFSPESIPDHSIANISLLKNRIGIGKKVDWFGADSYYSCHPESKVPQRGSADWSMKVNRTLNLFLWICEWIICLFGLTRGGIQHMLPMFIFL